ncbi:unnamed protein product [Oreochromis niloticus]|nr:unnamed protein product [Mustela putorius furo]
MEQTDVQADSAPPRVSQRERRPPAYLNDYEVSTLPLEGQTQTTQPATASQCSHGGKTRSSQRSSSSRSTRASRSSIGRFPSHALSELETAQLEERVKQMELEEFQQHLEEDQQVEYECQRLQAQAREAQQLQEEAIRTQEALTRQLERRRQLKKRVNELEIAKMVTSLLKEKAQEPSGSRVSPCPSEDRNSSTHAALPSVGPVRRSPEPLVIQPSTLTVTQPPAPTVAPPPVTMASHLLHSQCTPQVLHPTVPAGLRSTTFAPDTSYQASTPFSGQPSQYARAACSNPAETELFCTPKSELPTANAYPFLATGYGIPKPMIPSFESGRESDFALLKMALDNLLNSHPHLNEQYKYQVLLGHLQLPSAIQLAKAYMHDPTPYTTAMHALQDNMFSTWKDLIKTTARSLHGAADPNSSSPSEADDYIKAEILLLMKAQSESFPEEAKALRSGRPLPTNSRLNSLSPEYDKDTELIRVGGRLRRVEQLELDTIHPIILDPKHPLTKLIIQDFDETLLHPGPERVLAELRRRFWILRGREAVRRYQRDCRQCQAWRANPSIPKMADLPPARLRLYKPPFYSTGVDCFGPFTVKIGRRTEKRWGIVFKCMTTRCVHLDLLESLDTDSFLMSLRRFIARRGKPFELLCDNGTNFVGGARELHEAFETMAPQLKERLAEQQIAFRFNPPSAPHFGGAWEREVRSVKTALKVVLKEQTVPETVLRTVLVEVEGIVNAKPLGYVSSDIADPDPITPNILLMGRYDASLPQVVYDPSNLIGSRRWRHSQVLVDHFWSRFTRHYLPILQERQKWQKEAECLKPDQVVLIVDPQLPRALWPVGKVTTTYPGADGRIRTAAVKVKDRTYIRPVARLVSLPMLEEDKDPHT